MARTILIATIIYSVRSFICLLWLNVATAMRMIVIGSVVITTNVLTKAIILPSIFNILVSLFLDAKLAIILITWYCTTGFLFPFLSNSPNIGEFFTNIKPDLHFWRSGLLWLSNMLYDRDNSSRPILCNPFIMRSRCCARAFFSPLA